MKQLFGKDSVNNSSSKTAEDPMNCIEFKRIAFVLRAYQNDEMGQDKYEYLNTTLGGGNYSNAQLSDDFYYVVSTHATDYDFEILYNIVMNHYMRSEECRVETCKMYERNMRDRSKYEENQNKYHFADMDVREFLSIQLLDKIHCYFLHSYHQNHRLRNDELNDDDDDDNTYDMSKVTTLIRGRRNRQSKNIRGRRDNKYNMENMDKHKEEEEKKKEKDDPVYSFGVEYWYWSTGGDDDDKNRLIIPRKYASLKEELLDKIRRHQWDVLIANAKEMSAMIYVNATYRADWNKRGVKRGSVISESHLICLMVYCNYDVLQRKLTETYRKLNSSESADAQVKRHSNYHHLGKYLYEAVNIFGKSIKDYGYKQFYHGISDEMMFASPKARIYGPLSTTISLSVAVHFSDEEGLVVALKGDEWEDNKYFDMSWISAFASESECFFIGGLLPLRFHNILNTKSGVNYKKYLPKFNILFTKILSGVKYQFGADKERKIIERLINNRLIDEERNKEYIYRLFDYYCNERDYLSINYPYFQKEFDAFFDVNDRINLDELLNVFPNVRHLKIDYCDLSKQFMQQVEEVCCSNKNTQKIQLNWPNAAIDQVDKIIHPFKEPLSKAGFEIIYQQKENKLFIQRKE